MENQNQNQKEIKFVFRIDSQFAADAAADGLSRDGEGQQASGWPRVFVLRSPWAASCIF